MRRGIFLQGFLSPYKKKSISAIMQGMDKVDFLVIGAGAAGLSGALYAARSGLKVLVLDGDSSGGQASQIDVLENYPGLFPPLSGGLLIENLKKQALSFGAKIIGAKALSISKNQDEFEVSTSEGDFKALSLLYAGGARPKKLGLPGEDAFYAQGVSYCAVCDGPFFKGKRVCVVGGGDSACTEAVYLSSIAKEVILVHRRASFRAQRANSIKLLKRDNITVLLNTRVKEILDEEESEAWSKKSGGGNAPGGNASGVNMAGLREQNFASGWIIPDINGRSSGGNGLADGLLGKMPEKTSSGQGFVQGKGEKKGKLSSIVIQNVLTGKEECLPVDAVFIFAGREPETSILDGAYGVRLDDNGYVITDENMQTSLPGLFCAGDVRKKALRQIVTACSDGATAAFFAEKYISDLKMKGISF